MKLFILLIINLSTFNFANDILAKVDDRVITKNDFIIRSEYTIRPSYCKSNNLIHKKIILNSLIAEKLLAIDIESYISDENFSDKFLQGIKEQYMREYLLKDAVYSKIKEDSLLFKNYLKNSRKKYDLNFITISLGPVVNTIEMLISDGISFDEICRNYLNLKEIPETKIDFFYENDPAIHKAIFSKTLNKDEILGPILSKDNKWLFIKVKEITSSPIITETENSNHLELVYKKIYELNQIEAYDKYILEVMEGYNLNLNKNVFFKLTKEAYKYYIDRKNLINNEVLSSTLKFSKLDSINYYDEVFKLNNVSYNVSYLDDLISKHPLVFRKKNITKKEFALQFKYALVDLIRDERLNQIAYENNYHLNKDVIKDYMIFSDASISRLHIEALLKNNNFSMNQFNQNPELAIDNYLNEYIDSLQQSYSDKIEINFEVFDNIELTSIDLYAYKNGVPYPMIVPIFPVLTNKSVIDYGKEVNF